MDKFNIVYDGSGLSGRQESLRSILKLLGNKSRLNRNLVGITDMAEFKLEISGITVDIIAHVLRARSFYAVYENTGSATDIDHFIAVEFELLKKCDGIVFVVDSRSARHESSCWAFSRLKNDLDSMSIDINEIPIVFQASFRDSYDAVPMSLIREKFFSSKSRYFESNPTTGAGTLEAIVGLLQLLNGL